MKNSAFRLTIFAFLGLILFDFPVLAAPKLDLVKIKALYKGGEFEKVCLSLESFLKKSDAMTSREDKVSAYKYLGVVYASKEGGRPQAEAYFLSLFDLAPKVTLTELYVSFPVNQVFNETRDRFNAETQSASTVDEFGNPIGQDAVSRRDQRDAMTLAENKGNTDDSLVEKKTRHLSKTNLEIVKQQRKRARSYGLGSWGLRWWVAAA